MLCKWYNTSKDRSDGCKAQYQLLTLAKQNLNLLEEEIAQKGKHLREAT